MSGVRRLTVAGNTTTFVGQRSERSRPRGGENAAAAANKGAPDFKRFGTAGPMLSTGRVAEGSHQKRVSIANVLRVWVGMLHSVESEQRQRIDVQGIFLNSKSGFAVRKSEPTLLQPDLGNGPRAQPVSVGEPPWPHREEATERAERAQLHGNGAPQQPALLQDELYPPRSGRWRAVARRHTTGDLAAAQERLLIASRYIRTPSHPSYSCPLCSSRT